MSAANWTGSLEPFNRFSARLTHALQSHQVNIRKFTWRSNKHFTKSLKKRPDLPGVFLDLRKNLYLDVEFSRYTVNFVFPFLGFNRLKLGVQRTQDVSCSAYS